MISRQAREIKRDAQWRRIARDAWCRGVAREPEDGEPTTAEDLEATAESRAEIERGDFVTLDDVEATLRTPAPDVVLPHSCAIPA